MFTYPLALAAFIAIAGGTGSATATAVPRSSRQEFILTMRKHNLDPKIMANVAKSSSSLTKSIKEKAIMVPPGRKLEDAEADAEADENQAQNNYQGDKNNYNFYSQNYVQGTDDYGAFNKDYDWQNDWGFDASQYSLSYERCATVKHFDLDLAAQEDSTSPFRAQHFAVLRLCPAKTCDLPNWYMYGNDDAEEDEAQDEGEEQETDDSNKYQGRDGVEYGANGQGCTSNYATFMLDAAEYLKMMGEYEDVQFEMYCNYCDHYMQQQYQKYVNNGGHRHLEFEEFKNDPEVARKLGGDWDACRVEANVCKNGFQDDYLDLLYCSEVQKDNGLVAYAAAACAADGQTITVGLYADEYCTQDISSYTNVANWIGEEVDDEAMAHYYKKINSGLATLLEAYGGKTNLDPDSLCMACKAENQAWFLSGDDDSTGGEIAEICTVVFNNAARCDKTLNSWWKHKVNAKYAESNALQDLSCSYIDAMRMGNYDTEGNVVQDNNRLYHDGEVNGLEGNIFLAEYGQGIAKVSPWQYFWLIASISAFVALASYAVSLHRSAAKGSLKWKPRRGVRAGNTDDADITQNDSGIVMGRSQSNHTSYYMS